MGGFIEQFRMVASQGQTEPAEPEVIPPAWLGPPEDELGVAVPQSLVVGRSADGVVALRQLTAFSTGLLLDLVAVARGLEALRTQALFHEQHVADPGEGLPDGFLRVGVEYPDGRQAANVADRRALWQTDGEPEAPVLFQAGGGGGSAGGGRVKMNPAYWLWPLPPAGSLRLFVEWPVVGIELSSVGLSCAPLLEAAARSQDLWAR